MSDEISDAVFAVTTALPPGVVRVWHRCGAVFDVPVDDVGISKRCPICEGDVLVLPALS